MDLDVLFVGTAGSAPSARRGLPATLVRRGGDRLLFDCGEGTPRQLVRSVGLIELEPNDELERDGYRIAAFAVDHGPRAIGYALVEEERPGHLDPGRAE